MGPKKAQSTLLAFAKGSKTLDAIAPDAADTSNKRSRDSTLATGIVDPEWKAFLQPLISSPVFENIEVFLEKEYSAGKEVFPAHQNIFSAFNFTPLNELKVVLIGQDPYHDNGQAHGLCFSVLPGVKVPPSLVNMYKELQVDIPGFVPPSHGYLESWARQGVLMLNATLTVEAHKPNSHAGCGWQAFTDGVIKKLGHERSGIVFLLWGGFAQKKSKLIDASKHKIIECAHPSPLSATKWWGCKTFSKCNDALTSLGKKPVDWNLPSTSSAK